MRISRIIILLLFAPGFISFGQTAIQETFPTTRGEKVFLKFDEPHNVHISVYDGRDISYTGTVSINLGENDDHYELASTVSGDRTEIRSFIRDMKSLPQRMRFNIDGEEYVVRASNWSDPQVKQLLEEKGRDNIRWVSHGPQIEIDVEVRVPRDIDLMVESKFGLVEMDGITSELAVTSKFGGVDLSVPNSGRYEFDIDCEWGEVFTNLDLVVPRTDKGIAIKAEEFIAQLNGGGKTVQVNSKHGNIYLRSQ